MVDVDGRGQLRAERWGGPPRAVRLLDTSAVTATVLATHAREEEGRYLCSTEGTSVLVEGISRCEFGGERDNSGTACLGALKDVGEIG